MYKLQLVYSFTIAHAAVDVHVQATYISVQAIVGVQATAGVHATVDIR
jgi:hypothetical protein